MPTKRLTNEQKVFIVEHLACFKTLTETQTLVKVNFDIQITRQAVEAYDPTTSAGSTLRPGLRTLFAEKREKFLEHIAGIDVSHKAFRLRELSELYHQAKKVRNDVVAAAHLEQAAKEMGGIFTNKREHSGPNGGAITISLEDKARMQAGNMLKSLMDKGINYEEARASLMAMGVHERDIPSLNI